jgi:hypothetical protein
LHGDDSLAEANGEGPTPGSGQARMPKPEDTDVSCAPQRGPTRYNAPLIGLDYRGSAAKGAAMHQSKRQRVAPSVDPSTATKHRSTQRRVGLLLAVVGLGIAGCGNEPRISDPLTSLGNPFSRPSEPAFRAMIKASCGTKRVGDTTVTALLNDSDGPFNTLVSSLYSGDISNDEFMNQVLLEHPANDANVPATGCIIDQLAQCFADECKVQTPAERSATEEADQIEAEAISDEVTIDPVELPSENRAEVEQMIETSNDEGPQPLP